jgi:hypothetical protein
VNSIPVPSVDIFPEMFPSNCCEEMKVMNIEGICREGEKIKKYFVNGT